MRLVVLRMIIYRKFVMKLSFVGGNFVAVIYWCSERPSMRVVQHSRYGINVGRSAHVGCCIVPCGLRLHGWRGVACVCAVVRVLHKLKLNQLVDCARLSRLHAPVGLPLLLLRRLQGFLRGAAAVDQQLCCSTFLNFISASCCDYATVRRASVCLAADELQRPKNCI